MKVSKNIKNSRRAALLKFEGMSWKITPVPYDEKMKKFQVEVVEPEFKDAISNGIIEEIYWVGGEPLMYEIHWWALEEMINNGSAKNCYLRYNSNLSRIKYKGIDLYQDLLVHFRDWQICASIDATGEIGEWIRDGLNYEQWLQNFRDGLKDVDF